MEIPLIALLVAGLFVPASPPAAEGLLPMPDATPDVAAPASGHQEETPAPVDVNSASAEELQEVPGIGPAISRRIVEFRQEHGRLERLEDLLHVRGIGAKTLDRLRPYLTVGEDEDESRLAPRARN